MVVGEGVGAEEDEAKPKSYEINTWAADLSPMSSYQPRFRQSKVMTPFSSGVHFIPGGMKTCSFTSLVRLLQIPWLGVDPQDGHNPQDCGAREQGGELGNRVGTTGTCPVD